MKRFTPLLLLILTLSVPAVVPADAARAGRDKDGDEERLTEKTFKGLVLRGIGPAVNSGRIGDIAVHPTDHRTWFLG